jgi:hypothetical protein
LQGVVIVHQCLGPPKPLRRSYRPTVQTGERREEGCSVSYYWSFLTTLETVKGWLVSSPFPQQNKLTHLF